jgi:glycosyltransferase involved in cell wall biosynthesis
MISVCIPTWGVNGDGGSLVGELLESLVLQTFTDYEVVVSDHSDDDLVSNVIDLYKSRLNINYTRNTNDVGNSPSNVNNTIRRAKGDIIKIMFQDDLFVDINALNKINKSFDDSNCQWLVTGCNHTTDGVNFYREMVPRWNPNILIGVNTISSPSVLSFRNQDPVFFDESLVMLMDVEYYHRLYLAYGLPTILDDVLVSNRLHDNQISSNYNEDIVKEVSYVKNKHSW